MVSNFVDISQHNIIKRVRAKKKKVDSNDFVDLEERATLPSSSHSQPT